MKHITTSNGEFLVTDVVGEEKAMILVSAVLRNETFYKLSEITEEEADRIVDWNDEKQYYYKYPHKDWQGDITAKESLNFLLLSNNVKMIDNTYIFKCERN